MTPEEFARQMAYIRQHRDSDEYAHQDMDILLAKVLTELGYGDGIKIFNEQEKWYA